MKICILASGRCGSTSLFECIDKHLPKFYYSIYEPFHRLKETSELDSFFLDMSKKENVIIKTLMVQGTERFGIDDGKALHGGIVDIEKFNDWVYNTFDKIILLDRREQKLQVESMAYHLHLNDDLSWHKKKYYNINKISPSLLKYATKTLEHTKNKLVNFGIDYKIKIYYYEDIFVDKNMDVINEIFDYIGVKPNKEMIETYIFSEEYKVRLDKKYNKIL